MSRKSWIIIAVVAVLIAAGGAAWYFFSDSDMEDQPTAAAAPTGGVVHHRPRHDAGQQTRQGHADRICRAHVPASARISTRRPSPC